MRNYHPLVIAYKMKKCIAHLAVKSRPTGFSEENLEV